MYCKSYVQPLRAYAQRCHHNKPRALLGKTGNYELLSRTIVAVAVHAGVRNPPLSTPYYKVGKREAF